MIPFVKNAKKQPISDFPIKKSGVSLEDAKKLNISMITAWSFKPYMSEVASDLSFVEKLISAQTNQFDPSLRSYVSAAIENQGKGIRPALSLLTARAAECYTEAHLELAMIVELIHLASLIHDDIIDQSLLRRSEQTLHARWGADIAVLVGDCLLAHALKSCTRLPDSSLTSVIADCAHEVCAGEILQNQRAFDLNLTIEEYLRIIGMKTGALFRVSTELAAKLGKANHAIIQATSEYGQKLGTAYQIYDDCMDLFGSEEEVHKSVGADFRKGKWTLPLLAVFRKLGLKEQKEWMHYLQENPSDVKNFIFKHAGHVDALNKAQALLNEACHALNAMPSNGFTEAMRKIPSAFSDYLENLK